ncbi:M20 family metallo-hydrolase [Streptomyces phaeochromogenes]|uniref:M20 family metallo-hydrolase n=1 Tax=Streptomyces phaeochromogenes TaxID=1923 RepID=A0ABZ1HE79_STRPH|nr:M20 family metallo-hydrolase [Streptomyces phaeochromogenes]WSD15857.1 M20 family metallo-hydrolase [Streptomyces phaeochromogenes]
MSTPDATLLKDFATLSAFGATSGGGVDRQAATAADGEQRAWLHQWLTARGAEVRYDGVGNQFGLFTVIPGAPYVLTGSHLDSQPLGGRYDGAYGVLASAHAAHRAVQRWNASDGTPRHNVAVVNWFNEEGSRFKPSMMGSAVFTGKLPAETALTTTDPTGTTVEAALREIGTIGDYPGPDVAAYAEIHIEQGRDLENKGLNIGLVDATWAARKYQVVVRGEQSHTGSTVMADRRDALLGASLLVVAVRELAEESTDIPLHTSVSEMTILPNSPVVVAREVRMHVDLRSPDEALLDAAAKRLAESIPGIEERASVTIGQVQTHGWGVAAFPATGVELAAQAADELSLSHQTMMTIAGHDSVNMKDIAPSIMLFVPSVEGISHNEGELTDDTDISAGTDLLTEVVHRLMSGALD